MGINNKSLRIRGWRDALHLKGVHKPDFSKSVKLLTWILAEIYSPGNLKAVRAELAKLLAEYPDLTPTQFEESSVLQEKIDRKFMLLQERADKRKTKKLAAKESKKAAVATPAQDQETTRWG